MIIGNVNIETKRLNIRNITESDAEDYFEIFGNPVIAKFDDFSPITRDEAADNVKDIMIAYCKDAAEWEFAVELKEGKKVIGILYLKNENRKFFTGYHFNESWHGNGFAREAVQDFICFVQNKFNCAVQAVVDPLNIRSINLLEKLSFAFVQEKITKKDNVEALREFVYEKPCN